ncbi:MAG: hypothetical protein J1F05_01540 [Muribaculaceae bacterium]|nr:hypothetical protein [Muribaculaceae bacterium]
MYKIDANYIKTHIPMFIIALRFGYDIKGKKMIKAWWRGETNASVLNDEQQNKLFDFGTNEQLSIIDVWMKCTGLNKVQAIQELRKLCESLDFSVEMKSIGYDPKAKREDKFIIHEERDIQDPKNLAYIRKRCVSLSACNQLCREIVYSPVKCPTMRFTAIGIRNNSGAYDIRSYNPNAPEDMRNFKGCTGVKDITYIEQGSKHLYVAEGMFTLLSLLSLEGWSSVGADLLCLNSVSCASKAIKALEGKHYSESWIITDPDQAGRACFAKLINGISADKHHYPLQHHFIGKYPEFYKENPTADLNDWMQWAVANGKVEINNDFRLIGYDPQ